MTSFDTIAAAIHAAIVSVSPAATVVDSDDFAGLPQEVERALAVRLVKAVPDEIVCSGAPQKWTSFWRIDAFCRRDDLVGGARPSLALLNAANDLLIATGDLGGLVMTLDLVALQPDTDRVATRLGVHSGLYRTWHRTQSNSLN